MLFFDAQDPYVKLSEVNEQFFRQDKDHEGREPLWLRIPKQEELLWCVLHKALRGLESQHKEWKKMFIVLCCLCYTYISA